MKASPAEAATLRVPSTLAARARRVGLAPVDVRPRSSVDHHLRPRRPQHALNRDGIGDVERAVIEQDGFVANEARSQLGAELPARAGYKNTQFFLHVMGRVMLSTMSPCACWSPEQPDSSG